jgi:hypothetical protein
LGFRLPNKPSVSPFGPAVKNGYLKPFLLRRRLAAKETPMPSNAANRRGGKHEGPCRRLAGQRDASDVLGLEWR